MKNQISHEADILQPAMKNCAKKRGTDFFSRNAAKKIRTALCINIHDRLQSYTCLIHVYNLFFH